MNLTDDSIFTLPLTRGAHQVAEQFRQQQSNPQKAKQVYLNTLAVQAVNHYLEWMGVETDLAASDSWNPMLQSLADVADLTLVNQGKLECRPVLPGERTFYVPAEVWAERLGYVAVQFDTDLTEATLLGFLPSVQALSVSLEELRSLDELFDHLTPTPAVAAPVASPIINLSRWIEAVAEEGWQTLDRVFGSQQLAFSMRGGEVQSGDAVAEINRGKPLILGSYEAGEPVVLLVGILPHQNQEWGIWVRVAPSGGEGYLPTDLQVSILDEMGVAIMQAQSRQTEMIQLRFTGQPGEQFDVQLALGADSITESFII
ncbi:DUF1822 family protein [Leptolyngbya sp. FACHB-16]|uniref:DUF1822 family protein n=1 Tax=unclassified Leptolyngbya TaxID=2650499 RepID=UPI0016890617|nr:DUF1822 family protein [Leptolyngbya sp. FACHB-16]MBD2158545.1 DUF1822 family protein [Leptolyngbya sp. FACHB-16]